MTARWEIREGDCLELMAAMPEASVDAVVCDPPYGLEFMGKEWDRLDVRQPDDPTFHRSGAGPFDRAKVRHSSLASYGGSNGAAQQGWHEAWAREALRVLKPGGHLLAFGGTRTYHRLACAVEDAGFEIRDCIAWMYGSGFPKSLDVSKAIDRAAGAEREVVGTKLGLPGYSLAPDQGRGVYNPDGRESAVECAITAPATPEAERWQGWGTALKPAYEPIVVARKPLSGTVAGNVLAHGTGALNIDGCRVANTAEDREASMRAMSGERMWRRSGITGAATFDAGSAAEPTMHDAGRWPANVVLDEEAAAMLDEQTGNCRSAGEYVKGNGTRGEKMGAASIPIDGLTSATYADSGGASRFFYCAKASSTERGTANTHPTVKPVELMRWLVRLVTPPGGLILDPFAGSGTTGIAAMREGFSFVGIERDPTYVVIARERIRDDAPLLNMNAEVAA